MLAISTAPAITMIVRPRQHWLRLLFVWRGSVLHKILFRLVLNLALALAAVLCMPQFKDWGLHLSTAPFSLIGIALAVFLGFRNNASYDRYWEARKLWGMLLLREMGLWLHPAAVRPGRDGRHADAVDLGASWRSMRSPASWKIPSAPSPTTWRWMRCASRWSAACWS
jgi:hypothetical protein